MTIKIDVLVRFRQNILTISFKVLMNVLRIINVYAKRNAKIYKKQN